MKLFFVPILFLALVSPAIPSPPAQSATFEGRISQKLTSFLHWHPKAKKVLTDAFAQAFARRTVKILYFYSNDEAEAPALHCYDEGGVDVQLRIRENQDVVDEYICLLFETLNSNGEPQFRKKDLEAAEKKISRDKFALETLKIEFPAKKKTRDLLARTDIHEEEASASIYYRQLRKIPDKFEDFLAYSKPYWRSRNPLEEYKLDYDGKVEPSEGRKGAAIFEERLSPELAAFIENEPKAGASLHEAFAEVFAEITGRIFYYYSEEPSDQDSYFFLQNPLGSRVCLCVREGQHVLDEYACLLFEARRVEGQHQTALLYSDAESGLVTRDEYAMQRLKIRFSAFKQTFVQVTALGMAPYEALGSKFYTGSRTFPNTLDEFLADLGKDGSNLDDTLESYRKQHDAIFEEKAPAAKASSGKKGDSPKLRK